MPFTNEGGTRKIMKKNAHKKSKRQRGGNSKRQRGGNSKKQRGGNSKELFHAIDISDYAKVKDALNNGANVNAQNKDGKTPLIRAIKDGNIDIVYLLLEHPDIELELNLDTNKELALAETETSEGEEQNGIPYAIEEYITRKIREAQEAKEALVDVANKIGTENPNTNAARVLGQKVTVMKDGKKLDIHPFPREINRYVGGKRKTRKKNSRGRKTRKKNSGGRKPRKK